MSLIDKLHEQLETIEYKLERYKDGEVELSERRLGILLGKQNILNELIEDIENGNVE